MLGKGLEPLLKLLINSKLSDLKPLGLQRFSNTFSQACSIDPNYLSNFIQFPRMVGTELPLGSMSTVTQLGQASGATREGATPVRLPSPSQALITWPETDALIMGPSAKVPFIHEIRHQANLLR